MLKLILSISCLFAVAASAVEPIDCDDLDGRYREEAGFFSYRIEHSVIQKTGVVAYSGVDFHYRFTEPLHWDPRFKACVTKTFFNAYGCYYPVTGYMRKMIAGSNEYVFGTINPTSITPSYSCYQEGQTDRKWKVLRD